ncbi:uncharacterized protein BDW47DRAFT_107636 [Aspergillus candidus]|uniref:Uncharacterized protein n=1 Tax=Aspergillus candidus TaxID=41067 RepID=A0A2I2F8N5_ASPCN|nr:hypothetical protein BDW47DRAFT_107636 [Aspergillus candidus]PLB36990.1 hypothetical protein BDW47DRAFT_107636 [Aspergillus candidus]
MMIIELYLGRYLFPLSLTVIHFSLFNKVLLGLFPMTCIFSTSCPLRTMRRKKQHDLAANTRDRAQWD